MSYLKSSSFTNTGKGKVIIAFCIALIALILAWAVSKVAFKEMLTTVQHISTPDQKLRIVNTLFRDITKLDQAQRSKAFQGRQVSYKAFLRESDSLRSTMQSLKKLYRGDSLQTVRIDKMMSLLKERDSLFVSYIKVREGLVNGRDFSNQLNSLSGLINKSSSEIDSTIVTTEQKFSTTTVVPKDESAKERGFFSKIFGRKKNPENKVVKQEVSITVDTLARANSDSVINAMENAVKTLAKRQRQRSASFVSREIELSNAGNILINEMLVILQQVEKEVIRQADLNNSKATDVVNRSARDIEIIMLGFVLITAFFVYLILTDISRSNAYREELEDARDEAEYHSMAKQRFLSSMSHEIRTPLQSIIGYAEKIRNEEKPLKKDVNVIYQSSLHLLHIVNEVLDYSRIISGKFKFQRSTFSISQLLEEVLIVMRPQAEQKHLSLVFNSQISDIDLIMGDPFRLKQILFNLLGNAIKFTDAGEVSLTVKNRNIKRRCFFTFEIRDTGRGISKAELSSIFGEFEQAAITAATGTNGTGLGLSIVKALTEGQGGTVDVESEEGKGSCFSVKLRYLAAKEAKKESVKRSAVKGAFEGKVWIVDDDSFILQLCCSIFEKNQVSHTCFNRPEDVLDEAVPEDLKVVLMDMRMPGMNGVQLCRLLRERLPSGIRIYALTAQALPDERSSILEHGFDGILMKPFRESELLELLYKGGLGRVEGNGGIKTVNGISAIEKMAMGDKELVKKIIMRFRNDTSADIGQLKDAMNRGEVDQVSLILHRIAGRTAQVGASELAQKFRTEEVYLYEHSQLQEEQKKRIEGYTSELDLLEL